MIPKVIATILNESTGWTVVLTKEDGTKVTKLYVSGRNFGSPHAEVRRKMAMWYGTDDVTFVEGGNSPDYEFEMRAIANDRNFMS